MRLTRIGTLVVLGLAVATAATPQSSPAVDLGAVLTRVGERVADYFARAQSLICRETIRVQKITPNFSSDGSSARQLIYDLRVAWEPAPDGDGLPEAKVLREIVSINGRVPRAKDKPRCFDPLSISPEPLGMLLPGRQQDYTFTWAGLGKLDGRSAAMVDYRSRQTGKPAVSQREDTGQDEDCLSVDMPGKYRGRVWIDQETGDVLRLDEWLIGMVDFDVPLENRWRSPSRAITLERDDTSIRYRRVSFQNPEESLMLPASIDSVTIYRNSSAQSLRRTQRFSDYRRFVTEGRIVQ